MRNLSSDEFKAMNADTQTAYRLYHRLLMLTTADVDFARGELSSELTK